MRARFGVAGNSDAFSKYSKSSLDAPAWLHGQGLDWYEYQCGRGVRISQQTAAQLGENARRAGIGLSLHAPYFISLANPEAVERNIGYVLATCQAAAWMGAGRVVIHSGALMGRSRAEALDITKDTLRAVIAACDDAGLGQITLCPETMGKINQLGDLDEVLELCRLDERLLPCVDFGHLYARSLGSLNGREAFCAMLDKMASALGRERAARFHSHFSKIEFTLKGGEYRHLQFSDPGWGPDFAPLAEEIARRDWHPVFVCESAGTQSEDALQMKETYFKIKEAEERK